MNFSKEEIYAVAAFIILITALAGFFMGQLYANWDK